MPFCKELLMTVVSLMTILPLLFAFVVNVFTTAMSLPPAALYMSKSVSTAAPLMETLNSRAPAAAK